MVVVTFTSYWVEIFNTIQEIMIKKILAFIGLLLFSVGSAWAQKTALVDMEYIMGRIPAYATMTRQLEEQSKKWQAEVTKLENEANALYKKFQAEAGALSNEQRRFQEEAIVAKERSAYELKRKYFGPEGELLKRREELMKPIQTEVWKALKDLAQSGGIQLILDKSSGKIVYADPTIDLSALTLKKMGYQN